MGTGIEVANNEWEILDDVKDALAGAIIDGKAVFGAVTFTTMAEQAREAQLKGPDTPFVIVEYASTHEYECIEDERGGVITANLFIATRTNRGVNESAAVKEILRLMNAAKNAVEADPPADTVADYWGSEFEFHNKIEWGNPRFGATGADRNPWVTCTLPISLSFRLTSPTAH